MRMSKVDKRQGKQIWCPSSVSSVVVTEALDRRILYPAIRRSRGSEDGVRTDHREQPDHLTRHNDEAARSSCFSRGERLHPALG